MDYTEVRSLQLQLVSQRQRGESSTCGESRDVLLLVEHPHVITLGRGKQAQANVLAAADVPVVSIERGGDVTYHGPGQLVGYPIFLLREHERDLHQFLRNLEQAMIHTLAAWGIAANRSPGNTGVWVSDKKIASIGISCRRWVTFHGFALNVTTNLDYFRRINPCGFDAGVMTNMAQCNPTRPITMPAIKGELSNQLAQIFEREIAG